MYQVATFAQHPKGPYRFAGYAIAIVPGEAVNLDLGEERLAADGIVQMDEDVWGVQFYTPQEVQCVLADLPRGLVTMTQSLN